MYEVFTRSIPYPDYLNGKISEYYIRNKIINENYRPEFKLGINESIEHLITQCWSRNPNDRPDFDATFKSLSNKTQQYYLNDVESEKINTYVDKISSTHDPVEALRSQLQLVLDENKIIKEEIKSLRAENEK